VIDRGGLQDILTCTRSSPSLERMRTSIPLLLLLLLLQGNPQGLCCYRAGLPLQAVVLAGAQGSAAAAVLRTGHRSTPLPPWKNGPAGNQGRVSAPSSSGQVPCMW
jgi:hypothetical protein